MNTINVIRNTVNKEVQDEECDYEVVNQMASANWFSPASVSLAKLDEIKSSLYKRPASARIVRPKPKSKFCKQFKELATEPPLTKLSIQKSAWGSNTSIPDLIKQQGERQKAVKEAQRRPWSARKAQTRTPSCCMRTDKLRNSPQAFITVEGASCLTAPDLNQLQSPNLTNKYAENGSCLINSVEDSVQTRLNCAARYNLGKFSAAYASDEQVKQPLPPTPCTSPDLDDMLQPQMTEEDVNDIETYDDYASPMIDVKLLRRPTLESLHMCVDVPVVTHDEEHDVISNRMTQKEFQEHIDLSIASEIEDEKLIAVNIIRNSHSAEGHKHNDMTSSTATDICPHTYNKPPLPTTKYKHNETYNKQCTLHNRLERPSTKSESRVMRNRPLSASSSVKLITIAAKLKDDISRPQSVHCQYKTNKDIETLMSQIAICVDENISDYSTQDEIASSSIATKLTSSNIKNYYQAAIDKQPTTKPKYLTTKTIDFNNGQLTETKSVCELQCLRHKPVPIRRQIIYKYRSDSNLVRTVSPLHKSPLASTAKQMKLTERRRNTEAVKALRNGSLTRQKKYDKLVHKEKPKIVGKGVITSEEEDDDTVKDSNPNSEESLSEFDVKLSEMQANLMSQGLHIPLQTLQRGLCAPYPNDYQECIEHLPKQGSSSLLDHPKAWLGETFKKYELADKALQRANIRILEQQNEADNHIKNTSTNKRKRTKKKKRLTSAKSKTK